MLVNLLLRIIEKIQKVSRAVIVFFLILLGVFLADVVLHYAGFYTNIPAQNMLTLLRLSIIPRDKIEETKNFRYKILRDKQPENYSDKSEYVFNTKLVYDPDYGIALLPDCKCLNILKTHGELIWNVTNETDSFGRRKVPGAELVKPDQFIVFYGGSRTFGEGVLDSESMPAQFQANVKSYRVYNYGIPSAGANLFLKKQEDRVFQKQIPQKSGVFLYVFDYTHEDRILGTRYVPWSYKTPYYDLNSENELIYKGTFWSARFMQSFAYQLLSMSAIYQNLFLDLNRKDGPAELTERDLNIVTQVFLKMKDEAFKFNQSKFAVVFFEAGAEYKMQKIWQHLQSKGVETLVFDDQRGLPKYTSENFFKYDGHPKPAIYRIEAEVLLKELKQRKILDAD